MKFTTDSTTGGNSQIFDNGTSVGVGTTAPSATAKLDVAGVVNTSTQYNIGGSRVLGVPGTQNLFVGVGAGSNTTGGANTAVGNSALLSNTTGTNNTVIGSGVMPNNTTGSSNTANGDQALRQNTTGNNNTGNGRSALFSNITGNSNTANGVAALANNTTGSVNTAVGDHTLSGNITGNFNTAIGVNADVAGSALTNATAIGANAVVDLSNKIRLGDANITIIEAKVGLTVVSDKTKKENFQNVNPEEVLKKIGNLDLPSWNFIGQDPEMFRHYGPMAQDFFAAFGHDGVGQIGSPTTISTSDIAGIMMIAIKALEKRTQELKAKEARIAALEKETAELRAKQSYFETVAARLDLLELKLNQPIRVKGEATTSDEMARINP